MEKAHKPVRAVKVPGFMQRRIWAIMEIYVNSRLTIVTVPCLHQRNVHVKRSYGEGEPKNIIFAWVQKAHKPVRAWKVTGFMRRRIWETMEIYVNSGLPTTKAPCFHRSNVRIKRKLL